MAEFGGYEMPLWYSSSKNEHLIIAIRNTQKPKDT